MKINNGARLKSLYCDRCDYKCFSTICMNDHVLVCTGANNKEMKGLEENKGEREIVDGGGNDGDIMKCSLCKFECYTNILMEKHNKYVHDIQYVENIENPTVVTLNDRKRKRDDEDDVVEKESINKKHFSSIEDSVDNGKGLSSNTVVDTISKRIKEKITAKVGDVIDLTVESTKDDEDGGDSGDIEAILIKHISTLQLSMPPIYKHMVPHFKEFLKNNDLIYLPLPEPAILLQPGIVFGYEWDNKELNEANRKVVDKVVDLYRKHEFYGPFHLIDCEVLGTYLSATIDIPAGTVLGIMSGIALLESQNFTSPHAPILGRVAYGPVVEDVILNTFNVGNELTFSICVTDWKLEYANSVGLRMLTTDGYLELVVIAVKDIKRHQRIVTHIQNSCGEGPVNYKEVRKLLKKQVRTALALIERE